MTQITFHAGVHTIETGNEKRLATFYIMNTSMNRNGWGVTEKSLDEASPTLLGKDLGIAPDYKVVGHPNEDYLKAGKFVTVDNTNKYYLLAASEIIDNDTWALLEAGKIGPISVVISPYLARCSHCWEELKIEDDPFTHSCVNDGDGYVLLESFTFDRVDFVDTGAYPQAGTLELQQLASQFIASRSTVVNTDGGLQGALNPMRKRGKTTLENKEEIQAMIAEATKPLLTQVTQLTADLKAEREKEHPEFTEIKTELDKLRAEQHTVAVMKTLEARVKAGLVEKRDEELTSLKEMRAESLAILENDALKLIANRKTEAPAQPITKYSQKHTDSLQAALDAKRLQVFGHADSLNKPKELS